MVWSPPNGFKREGFQVTLSQDNTTLEYEYRDVQQAMDVIPKLIAKIDVRQGVRQVAPGVDETVIGFSRLTAKAASTTISGFASPRSAVPAIGTLGFEIPVEAGIAAWGTLPRVIYQTAVDIWGCPAASLTDLLAAGSSILAAKWPAFGTRGAGSEIAAEWSLQDRHLTLFHQVRSVPGIFGLWGPGGQIANLGLEQRGQFGAVLIERATNDDVPGILTRGGKRISKDSPDSNRGTIGDIPFLFAAALAGNDDPPAQAPPMKITKPKAGSEEV